MLKMCFEKNIDYLDLFGISGDASPENELHGLYLFKKGFGGTIVEFIGEYDLIINKFYGNLFLNVFPILKKIKKKIN